MVTYVLQYMYWLDHNKFMEIDLMQISFAFFGYKCNPYMIRYAIDTFILSCIQFDNTNVVVIV